MPKKTGRTATKDLLKEVGLIQVKTDELKTIVNALPASSVKDAFTYSVVNLEKKIEKFTTVSVLLSDAQKEKLRAYRKSLIAETPQDCLFPQKNDEVSSNVETKSVKKEGKSKKK